MDNMLSIIDQQRSYYFNGTYDEVLSDDQPKPPPMLPHRDDPFAIPTKRARQRQDSVKWSERRNQRLNKKRKISPSTTIDGSEKNISSKDVIQNIATTTTSSQEQEQPAICTTTTKSSSDEISKRALPASDIPDGFPEELIFRALAAYATIRTLSVQLRISPFTPIAFLRALSLPYPNPLMGSIHVHILRILFHNLQMGYNWKDTTSTPPPLDIVKKRKIDNIKWPLRAGDNLHYLDMYTWPIFYDDYCHLTSDIIYASLFDVGDHIDFRALHYHGIYDKFSVAQKEGQENNTSPRQHVYYGKSQDYDDDDDVILIESDDEYKVEVEEDDDDDAFNYDDDDSYGRPKKKKKGAKTKQQPNQKRQPKKSSQKNSAINPTTQQASVDLHQNNLVLAQQIAMMHFSANNEQRPMSHPKLSNVSPFRRRNADQQRQNFARYTQLPPQQFEQQRQCTSNTMVTNHFHHEPVYTNRSHEWNYKSYHSNQRQQLTMNDHPMSEHPMSIQDTNNNTMHHEENRDNSERSVTSDGATEETTIARSRRLRKHTKAHSIPVSKELHFFQERYGVAPPMISHTTSTRHDEQNHMQSESTQESNPTANDGSRPSEPLNHLQRNEQIRENDVTSVSHQVDDGKLRGTNIHSRTNIPNDRRFFDPTSNHSNVPFHYNRQNHERELYPQNGIPQAYTNQPTIHHNNFSMGHHENRQYTINPLRRPPDFYTYRMIPPNWNPKHNICPPSPIQRSDSIRKEDDDTAIGDASHFPNQSHLPSTTHNKTTQSLTNRSSSAKLSEQFLPTQQLLRTDVDTVPGTERLDNFNTIKPSVHQEQLKESFGLLDYSRDQRHADNTVPVENKTIVMGQHSNSAVSVTEQGQIVIEIDSSSDDEPNTKHDGGARKMAPNSEQTASSLPKIELQFQRNGSRADVNDKITSTVPHTPETALPHHDRNLGKNMRYYDLEISPTSKSRDFVETSKGWNTHSELQYGRIDTTAIRSSSSIKDVPVRIVDTQQGSDESHKKVEFELQSKNPKAMSINLEFAKTSNVKVAMESVKSKKTLSHDAANRLQAFLRGQNKLMNEKSDRVCTVENKTYNTDDVDEDNVIFPINEPDHWSQFLPLKTMRTGIPYHKLLIEEKLLILEFLIDELLSVSWITAELSARYESKIQFNYPYGLKPSDVEMQAVKDANGDLHDEQCSVCNESGDVVCCDGCIAVYHSECAGLANTASLPDVWFCPECAVKDPSSFGPLRGGKKSELDWVSVEDMEAADRSNRQIELNGETCFGMLSKEVKLPLLVVHGYVFRQNLTKTCNGRLYNVNSMRQNHTLLTSKDLKDLLTTFGKEICTKWPIDQIPVSSPHMWNLEDCQASSYFQLKESYDPTVYRNKYTRAPILLEGLRRSREMYTAEEKVLSDLLITYNLSDLFTSDLTKDNEIISTITSSSQKFNALHVVKFYLQKIESDLSKASLLDEFWNVRELADSSETWKQSVKNCRGIKRISRLLLRLIDSTHHRAFNESWTHGVTVKNKENVPIQSKLENVMLSNDYTPRDESLRRYWERSQICHFPTLLSKTSKYLRIIGQTSQPGPSGANNKRKTVGKTQEQSAVSRTTNHAIDDFEKTQNKSSLVNKLRRKRESDIPSPTSSASNSKVDVRLDSQIRNDTNRYLRESKQMINREIHWPVAGKKLFDPLGYIPSSSVRYLGRNGGAVFAPFVSYSILYEVGQVAYCHVWRKLVLCCTQFEELIQLVRILEMHLDYSTINKCTSLVQRIKTAKGKKSLSIQRTQRDLISGIDHYLFGNGLNTPHRWESSLSIDLNVLVQDKYSRSNRRLSEWKQRLRDAARKPNSNAKSEREHSISVPTDHTASSMYDETIVNTSQNQNDAQEMATKIVASHIENTKKLIMLYGDNLSSEHLASLRMKTDAELSKVFIGNFSFVDSKSRIEMILQAEDKAYKKVKRTDTKAQNSSQPTELMKKQELNPTQQSFGQPTIKYNTNSNNSNNNSIIPTVDLDRIMSSGSPYDWSRQVVQQHKDFTRSVCIKFGHVSFPTAELDLSRRQCFINLQKIFGLAGIRLDANGISAVIKEAENEVFKEFVATAIGSVGRSVSIASNPLHGSSIAYDYDKNNNITTAHGQGISQILQPTSHSNLLSNNSTDFSMPSTWQAQPLNYSTNTNSSINARTATQSASMHTLLSNAQPSSSIQVPQLNMSLPQSSNLYTSQHHNQDHQHQWLSQQQASSSRSMGMYGQGQNPYSMLEHQNTGNNSMLWSTPLSTSPTGQVPVPGQSSYPNNNEPTSAALNWYYNYNNGNNNARNLGGL